MPGLLLFVMQGAEQCVNEQPRCSGVVGAHCTAAIIFAGLCGTLRRVSSLPIRSYYAYGDRPMPKQDRKTGVGEARQDGSPAREKNAFDLGERWLGSANKVDYLIRRRLIPDHPCESDRAFARAPPFRYSSPDCAWEFAPMTLHPATRGYSALHELQAAIGRCLRAEYDLVISEPIPDRLMTLLRQAG